ncbi:MAG: hypothetical protein K1X92_13980 [Bacteroidia bacterium]|nr:hypothetical protein [Bacteroidia bacterium]
MKKEVAVALETLKEIKVIREYLSNGLDFTPEVSPLSPSKEELFPVADELIILIAEGSSVKNEVINKVYQHHKSKDDTYRFHDTLEVYQFLKENWETISVIISLLRYLGYLKIEEHPTISRLIEKLKNKQ